MAMRKSTSRSIVVNGTRFRYAVSCDWSGCGDQDIRITVQDEKANGARLYVNRLRGAELGTELGDFEMAKAAHPVITVGHMAALITRAQASGWRHGLGGPGFFLKNENAAVQDQPEVWKTATLHPDNQ